eukprot:s1324_g21.t1
MESEAIEAHFSQHQEIDMVVAVVLCQEQWIPIAWSAHAKELTVSMWAHDDTDIHVLAPLHAKIAHALHKQAFTVACDRRTYGVDLCGAAAFSFCAHKLLDWPLPRDCEALQVVHQRCKQDFDQFVRQSLHVPRPWCWGHGNGDTLQLLATLLQFHGVPLGQTQQRAKMVLQSLGKEPVHHAISGVSPWRSLKALANLHQPPIQLILPDEQVAVSSKQGPKPKSKKASQPKSMPVKPADIDPTKLQLDAGMFCSSTDEPLHQLPLSHVGPLSTGVALATYQDALPFMKSGALLTSKALAIIVLNHQTDLDTTLQWSTIRFAARCTLNQEPMLLQGTLLQLGQTPVCQSVSKGISECPTTEVACARVTVYFDQWPEDREDFNFRPVKHILKCLPMLATCRSGQPCTCPAFHPAANECDAILDVFRRSFLTDGGKPVKSDKATHFCVFLRYAKSLEPAVLAKSGCAGIYIEPKTEDALQPHGGYQVVWLPQMSFEEICHKARCEATGLGITRTGNRYGIRVKAEDFSRAFASLKPDAVFLVPGQREEYQCGPWPFGLDRKSLAKVFKEWGWSARPLQPQQSVQGGLMWTVQAVSEHAPRPGRGV